MLHPSYTDLMKVVNSDVEQGETPVVQSRYSIVMATARRARQIIGGQPVLVKTKGNGVKPLSVAVEELHNSKIKLLGEDEVWEEEFIEEVEEAEEKTTEELTEEAVEEITEEVSDDEVVEVEEAVEEDMEETDSEE